MGDASRGSRRRAGRRARDEALADRAAILDQLLEADGPVPMHKLVGVGGRGLSGQVLESDVRWLESLPRVRVGPGPDGSVVGLEPPEGDWWRPKETRAERAAKRAVAEAALREAAGCHSVVLDAGSTCARVLEAASREHRGPQLRVITNNIAALRFADPKGVWVEVVGGLYVPDDEACVPVGLDLPADCDFDCVILGVSAVSAGDGAVQLYGDSSDEAHYKKRLVERALRPPEGGPQRRLVILADGLKIGGRDRHLIESLTCGGLRGDLHEACTLITEALGDLETTRGESAKTGREAHQEQIAELRKVIKVVETRIPDE